MGSVLQVVLIVLVAVWAVLEGVFAVAMWRKLKEQRRITKLAQDRVKAMQRTYLN